jgi:hypothetical protein
MQGRGAQIQGVYLVVSHRGNTRRYGSQSTVAAIQRIAMMGRRRDNYYNHMNGKRIPEKMAVAI